MPFCKSYVNGQAIEISKPITTTSFRTPCQINLEVSGNKMHAQVALLNQLEEESRPIIVTNVDINTEITQNAYGGFGLKYNGGSPTMIKNLKVEWK